MPLYRVVTHQGLLNPAQKATIAEAIVEMHLRNAGGLRAFVNVLFESYPVGDAFVGGAPGAPVILAGTIRAGRAPEVKTTMLQELQDLFVAATGHSTRRLIVNISDAPARNTMEAGFVLPEPGEEAAWLARVGEEFALV